MNIQNVNELPDQFVWKDKIGLVTKSLGAAAKSKKLYVNIDTVPPKAFSTKYHSHSQQEEFFLILGGHGTLRLNDEEHAVRKGDFIAKLPAQNMAHTFYNSSEDTLIILDVGTVEKEDTCFYPDEDIFLHKSNGINRIFDGKSLISGWESDPNEKQG